MDKNTIQSLIQLNNVFYSANASSFSQTRQSPWTGWSRIAETLQAPPERVLDVACGNMRFEAYLSQLFEPASMQFYAVDNCSEFSVERPDTLYLSCDVLSSLMSGSLELDFEGIPPCDLVVCFGFFHHVPGMDLRKKLLRALVDKTQERGILALSFWQFHHDAKLLQKAEKTTEQALIQLGSELDLDTGDYLLGWQDTQDSFRYCHSFSSQEIDRLFASNSSELELIDSFSADGKTQNLNKYLVCRKR